MSTIEPPPISPRLLRHMEKHFAHALPGISDTEIPRRVAQFVIKQEVDKAGAEGLNARCNVATKRLAKFLSSSPTTASLLKVLVLLSLSYSAKC